jgi:hypothetical protein
MVRDLQTTTGLQPRPSRALERSLGAITFLSRLAIIFGLGAYAGDFNQISRDSYWYDSAARASAEQYATGTVKWSQWIDEGWVPFTGFMYFTLGPSLLYIQLFNAALIAFATVLLYRLGLAVYEDHTVAAVAAYAFSLFPSVAYYTSLPLKESPAVFGLVAIVWGLTQWRLYRIGRGWFWIALGLVVVASLRVYLAVVAAGAVAVCALPWKPRSGIGGLVGLGLSALGLGLCVVAAIRLYEIDISAIPGAQYFDLEYINDVRQEMAVGKSGIFQDATQAAWTDDIWQNVNNALTGIYYFVFVVDPTNIRRARQAAAIPEMLLLVACLPYLVYGVIRSCRDRLHASLPVILFGVLIVCVYSGAATNGGAMYRWRVQALPFLILVGVYGGTVTRHGWLPGMLASARRRLSQMVGARPVHDFPRGRTPGTERLGAPR